ncbi:hypothetical protein LI328DRAFT_166026 [Trichoderma asperelloides]|nr:hypothetical protein LI328DRAFT_166026 [Trichoderma asperelloides]
MMVTTVPTVAHRAKVPVRFRGLCRAASGRCMVPGGACGRRVGSAPQQPVQGAYLAGTGSGTRYEHIRVVTSHFRNVHPYLQRRRQGCELLGLELSPPSPLILFSSLFLWSRLSGWRGFQNWLPAEGWIKRRGENSEFACTSLYGMADIGRIGAAAVLQCCISTCGFGSMFCSVLFRCAQLSSAQLSSSHLCSRSYKGESQLIARSSPIGTTTARQRAKKQHRVCLALGLEGAWTALHCPKSLQALGPSRGHLATLSRPSSGPLACVPVCLCACANACTAAAVPMAFSFTLVGKPS